MEIKINVPDKYLMLAAATATLMSDDKDFEEKIQEAVGKCKGAVVDVDVKEIGTEEESKNLLAALSLFALAKFLPKKE